MKRDMELVREILLKLEEHPHGFAPPDIEVEGYSREQIGFHCHLMEEAGLITGNSRTTLADSSPYLESRTMTWAGYEFLDNTKDPNIWQQTRQLVGKLEGASFSVWSAVAAQAVTKSLGIT